MQSAPRPRVGPHGWLCFRPRLSFLRIGSRRRRNSTRNRHPRSPAGRNSTQTAVLLAACSPTPIDRRQAAPPRTQRPGRGRGERTCRSRPWRLASWSFFLAADRAARLRVVVGRGRLPGNCGAAGWTGAARRLGLGLHRARARSSSLARCVRR